MGTMTIGEFLLRESWQWVVMLVLLGCSGFFSGSETALFSLSRGELHRLGQETRRLPRLVPRLMRDPGNVLATVLLGNNVVNLLYFITSTLMIVRVERQVQHGHVWGTVLAAGTLLGVLLAGEVVPKALAFVSARRLAPLAAPVLAVLGAAVKPVQRVLMVVVVEPLTRLAAPAGPGRTGLSGEEMAALLALSQKRGLIGRSENELLQEVLALTDLRAGDVMVPRVDMESYPTDGPVEGLLEIVRRKHLGKIVLHEGDLDHVAGVLDVRRLLAWPEKGLRGALQPVQFVPETARLERVLLLFRATRSQIAVVVDEYGGTAGVITLEAVLEEIVGELAVTRGEGGGPPVQQVGPGEWLVDGDLPVHEWAEAFPTDLHGARFTTVGGFVISLLGRIPRVGDSARYRNVTFTVEAVRQKRIALLRVRLREAQP